MMDRGGFVMADGSARFDRRRLLRLVPVAAVTVVGLAACGSQDEHVGVVEDEATRVVAAGAPDPLPTPDPNATPAEDATGGAASGAAGESSGDGGDDAAAAGGEVVELSAPGIAWSTNEITIGAGGTIRLTNDGSGGEHNFAVEGYNDDAPVDMPIGETVDWPIPADLAAGTYTFYCEVPGHRAAGMEGTLTIT